MPRRPIDQRQEFAVEDGHLVRRVQRPDGTSYAHRCGLAAYREVAWFLEAHAEAGVTTGKIWSGLPDVPCSQASVALAFLKERGCVEVRWRRVRPASTFLFEDSMTEFHALEVGSPT